MQKSDCDDFGIVFRLHIHIYEFNFRLQDSLLRVTLCCPPRCPFPDSVR